ncbi:BatD family protein [Saprospiraceae bacterium]|nr:BatD family protein [Saprospiraceae bacterium]
MLKTILLSTLFCLVYVGISAQVRFFVHVDPARVIQGSYVDVEFILENGDGSDFRPPSFKGFDVVSGPNQSTSMTIVNGRRSNKISLSYTLRSKSIGKQEIGVATIKTKSGVRKTIPVSVEVVKAVNNPNQEGESVFIISEISDSVAYVGQQLVLDYKLYTLLDVRTVNMVTEPEFDGFFKEEIRASRSGFQREIYNGKEYYTKSVKRLILFPQQTGTYDIEAVPIELGIAKKGSQQSRSFFFSQNLVKRQVVSTPLKIIVKNTPPTQLNFSGAVGDYRMEASTPKRSLTTDDAIIVKMKVVGNGDSKTVIPPKWPANDSLEVYDPNILDEEVYRNGAEITHAKIFEYLLVPKYTGRYRLKAEFTYYNPDSSEYFTLSQRLPTIQVLKGSNKPVAITTETERPIDGIMVKTKLVPSLRKSTYDSWWHNSILGLIGLSSLGLILFYRHKNKSGDNDPEEIRRKKAYSVALARLDKAKSLLGGDDSKAFYEEITIATKKYITDKYKIQAMHISNSEVLDQLKTHDVSDNIMSEIREIFNKSEMGLYAPSSSASKDQIYKDTLEVISQLES